MKKLLSLGVLVSAMAVPSMAYAGCAHTHGSYKVSCESGVTVYRGQIHSLSTVGPNEAQSRLRIAKMQQETARARINADRAIARERANLRAQELENARYAARRGYNNTSSRYGSNYGTGYGYGSYGYGSGIYGYGYGANDRRNRRNVSGIERINRRLDRAFGGQNGGRGRQSGTATPQPRPAHASAPAMMTVGTPRKAMKRH